MLFQVFVIFPEREKVRTLICKRKLKSLWECQLNICLALFLANYISLNIFHLLVLHLSPAAVSYKAHIIYRGKNSTNSFYKHEEKCGNFNLHFGAFKRIGWRQEH